MAAQVHSGHELSTRQYAHLKDWMRKDKRDFRSVLADIMEQEEFLEDLAESKNGEPAGRLADPRPERRDIKARLKEIASIIREIDPTLAKEIEDGTVTYDDPRITAFEAGADAEYKKAAAAFNEIDKQTADDYAKLANSAHKKILDAHDRMIKLREQLEFTDEKIQRMMDEEGKIAEDYLKKRQLAKANYEQAAAAFNDLIKHLDKNSEIREAIARREAKANERAKQKGIMRRQRAVRAWREISKNLVKRIARKISFETVAHEKAVTAKAIQRLFFEISDGINKWIGTEDRRILRAVWSQWSTDEEQFREKLLEKFKIYPDDSDTKKQYKKSTVNKITDILNKDWEQITVNEKKTLHKLLPKTDYIKELSIKALKKENWESAQLGFYMREINGKEKLFMGEDLRQKVLNVLGDELLNRLQNKPFNEWEISEAEELARVIDKLVVEGRRERAAQKEAERVLNEKYRDDILAALEKTKYAINPGDTPEEIERKKEGQDRILKKYAAGKKNYFMNNFFDGNLRRFTTALDGGRKGIFTNLLYWGENDAYNQKERQIAARRMVIEKVMKDNKISFEELYREIKIPGLEDTDVYRVTGGKLTVDDLLYIMRGYENEETRNAMQYGNFANARERGQSGRSIDDLASFVNKTRGRLMLVMRTAKEFFAKPENKKFMALYETIGTDYDNNGERLNKACIEMFNQPMWRVEKYVPMNRREQTGQENENRVIEDLLGVTGKGQKRVNRGMTVKRIKIKPGGQRPIELGLYKTWAKSVESTEHLLAYGPLVKRLNGVFKGFNAAEVRQTARDRWGAAALDRIDNTIAEFANPNPLRQRTELDNFVRALRGKTATAYLAWKTSGVLLQAVTSPWPYLQEINPIHYIPACLEVAGGFGKINDLIREKSIFMRNREIDPMIKIIKEQMEKNENRVLHAIDKFNKMGMQGLEKIDWAMVAPGWLAKYRQELGNVAKEQETKYQELLKKYYGNEYADVLPTPESKVNRALSEVMNEAQQDAEAVARADDAVRRMQPSSRQADIAPIFKNRNEIVSAVLQFQVSLNVIWQNIRYDLPLAVKQKQLWTVVGMVTGYAMAGICLGFLFDDDSDEEKEDRDWGWWLLYNALSQGLESVPVIGSMVSNYSEKILTGKTGFYGASSIFPSIEKALTGTTDLSMAIREKDPDKQQKRYLRAAGRFTEAIGIGLGLPVSGVKELLRAAGIGDGDGEFELHLEALLGRRK